MRDNSFYTKLIYEHKCPDDFGPQRIEQSETVWDSSLDDLLEMFHTIAIGAAFSEETFTDCLIYYLEDRGYRVTKEEDREEENND